jgi:ferrochelatase
MTSYRGEKNFDHEEDAAVGVLITNVGSPKAPTTAALREYLKQFLSDPRVIENQGLGWKLLLHGVILQTRPKISARAYQEVWTDSGSPLLNMVQAQAHGIEELLRSRIGSPIHVAVGMGYGEPSVSSALALLKEKGCRKIVVLPLFPQYAAATVGSTFDAVSKTLSGWRWVPEFRFISHYHDNQAYINALASTVHEHWSKEGEPERLLMSFHGLPLRTLEEGDPYHCQCQKTARLLREAIKFPDDRIYLTFQSKFGKEPWLQPYTDATLKEWGGAGVGRVDVVCPGFSADCLETIEEIGDENRGYFLKAGGKSLHYILALNDRPDHLAMLAGVIEQNLQGWVTGIGDWNPGEQQRRGEETRARAEALKAQTPRP